MPDEQRQRTAASDSTLTSGRHDRCTCVFGNKDRFKRACEAAWAAGSDGGGGSGHSDSRGAANRPMALIEGDKPGKWALAFVIVGRAVARHMIAASLARLLHATCPLHPRSEPSLRFCVGKCPAMVEGIVSRWGRCGGGWRLVTRVAWAVISVALELAASGSVAARGRRGSR